jgi:hypothetical protein
MDMTRACSLRELQAVTRRSRAFMHRHGMLSHEPEQVAGWCTVAASDVLTRLRRRGCDARAYALMDFVGEPGAGSHPAYREPELLELAGHCVVRAGPWAVDPTSKQYGLDRPYVYPWDHVERDWRVVEPSGWDP